MGSMRCAQGLAICARCVFVNCRAVSHCLAFQPYQRTGRVSQCRESSPYLAFLFNLGFSASGVQKPGDSLIRSVSGRGERAHVSNSGMCFSDLRNMYVFRVSQVPAFLPRKGLKHKHAG